MGGSDKKKNQRSSSLWTTTIDEDINKRSLLDQDIEKVIQNIKDKNIDIHKPIPEVERLKKIFEPKP